VGLDGYTKLFSSIVTSTIWGEDSDTRIVWITMLAMTDQHGLVATTIPGLARLSGVSLQKCEEAIEKFKGPDKYSRSKDYDGRRIVEVDGGFRLLNHAYYRGLQSESDRKAYQAEWARNRRQSRRQASTGVDSKSTESMHSEAEAYSEAETEQDPPIAPPGGPARKARQTGQKTDRKRKLPDDWKPKAQHHTIASELGVDLVRELEKFLDHCKANAWRKVDWDATFSNWLRTAGERQRRILPAGPRDSRADAQLKRQLERVRQLELEEELERKNGGAG
jgi:hypothetical protein